MVNKACVQASHQPFTITSYRAADLVLGQQGVLGLSQHPLEIILQQLL
jgi:hypothetical protein